MEQKNNNNINNENDIIEIDLIELINVVLKNLWLIIVIGIVFGAVTFVLCFSVIPPKFESVTKIYVINKQNMDTVSYQDLMAGSSLTKDYKEIVMSDPVLEEVIADTGVKLDIKELSKLISVEIPTDTRIVSITVKNTDPYLAKELADAVRVAASKHIKDVMDIEAVNVVSVANLPLEKSSPHTIICTVIGFLAGALITIIILCLTTITDETIKTPDDVEKFLGATMLGTIPIYEADAKVRKKSRKKRRRVE